MSFTRRDFFIKRLLPAGMFAAAGGASLSAAGVASAAGPAPHIDTRTRQQVVLERSLRLHPALQYAAQVQPDRRLRVIVQKRKASADGIGIANSAGATHKEAFDFIKSHVLELPAKNLLKLATHKDVAYITPDSKIRHNAINVTNLLTAYEQTIGVPALWNGTSGLTGAGVSVAILDSGVNKNHPDVRGNVTAVVVNPRSTGKTDANGHGTHVTGIITGNDPLGRYVGVAPDANVVSVQVADDLGMSLESDVIRGLQWVVNNKATYNIRVVNMSISGALPSYYSTGPMNAAVELAWAKGVIVVVSAGNKGSAANAVQYAPGNDPFVISVGATDDNSTTATGDDSLADFSSRGTTLDGFQKPDVVAPGRKIVAALAGPSVVLAQQMPDHIVDPYHIRLSGTSMAAPVVSGTIALILQRYPTLVADQVKWLVMNTARTYPGKVGNAGMIDPAAALAYVASVGVGAVPRANTGQALNDRLLAITSGGTTTSTSSYWDSSYWDSSYWDSSYWDSSYWDASYWDSASGFDSASFDAVFDTYLGD